MQSLTLLSLDENYVNGKFAGESKARLLERSQKATERALANSGFLHSHNIWSLQAYVLYLVCLSCL